ncbi:MAG: HlyD family efflux transporter periplasmic adaptor subunit [Planctomycetes bacterium]|nr:HlyD family efflux transporter periplasmic adaptor subunit [Planctomycetota bacterium]NOG53275.1 HlyD family efflux transporter periplasmic adaptor subunit [Planctomycetota bacterium]
MSQQTPGWPTESLQHSNRRVFATVSAAAALLAIAWSLPGNSAIGQNPSAGGIARQDPRDEPRLQLDEPYWDYQPDGYPAISTPSKALTLSFLTRGMVEEVLVKETQVVSAGDLLVKLDDRVQQRSLEAQKLAAEDETGVLTAERRLELAEFDLDNVLETERADAAAPREVERAKAERALAELNLQSAILDRKTNQLVYERDLAFSDHYRITSKISGIVARIDVQEGESVEELQPAISLVAIDPLWMDVAVPIQLGMSLKPGDTATVRWRDLPKQPEAVGTVLWVAPIADASSNRIIIRLEIRNPDLLPAGLHAMATFPQADSNLAKGPSSP